MTKTITKTKTSYNRYSKTEVGMPSWLPATVKRSVDVYYSKKHLQDLSPEGIEKRNRHKDEIIKLLNLDF